MEYFHRNLLTPNQKKIYDAVLSAVLRHQPTASIPVSFKTELSTPDFTAVYVALRDDQPSIFYFNRITSILQYDKETVCSLAYYDYPSVAAEKKRRIDQVVRSVVEPLKGKRDVEKALALHDYLSREVTYGFSAEKAHAYTIEGAFLEHTAVCEGISLAYMHLCRSAGLRAITVTGRPANPDTWFFITGDTSSEHAWNIIWINGRAYHVDATNDRLRDGNVPHTYFGMSQARLCRYLIPDPAIPLPPCPSSLLQMPYCETRKELLDAIRRFVSEGKTYFQIAISWQYDTSKAFGKDLVTSITPSDHQWYKRLIHYYYNAPMGIVDFVLK